MFLGHDDDAIGAVPEIHDVVFENDSVRVLKAVMPPGFRSAPHWHPENVVFVIQPGRFRYEPADGEAGEVELIEGQVIEGGGYHVVENVGKTEIQVLQIEFKK